MKQSLLLLLGISSLLFPGELTFAYSSYNTHPLLTQEIAEFYNLSLIRSIGPARQSFNDGGDNAEQSVNQISQEEILWMREGAIAEDEPPRWLNHFYNSVTKSGWTGTHLGTANPEDALKSVTNATGYLQPVLSAYEWAVGEDTQTRAGLNRSWQYAKRKLAEGDRKEAFTALGHILHLIEDTSVPDHVRGDAHPDSEALKLIGSQYADKGSPYEEFAREYTSQYTEIQIAQALVASEKEPLKLNTLRDAFDSLSDFSARHFFSEDTINNEEFRLPNVAGLQERIMDHEVVGIPEPEKARYLYDPELNLPLVYYDSRIQSWTTGDRKNILPAYYHYLTRQAVMTGAGVVDLFFREAAAENPDTDFSSARRTGLQTLAAMMAQVNRFVNLNFNPFNFGAQISSFFDDVAEKLTSKLAGLDPLSFSASFPIAEAPAPEPAGGPPEISSAPEFPVNTLALNVGDSPSTPANLKSEGRKIALVTPAPPSPEASEGQASQSSSEPSSPVSVPEGHALTPPLPGATEGQAPPQSSGGYTTSGAIPTSCSDREGGTYPTIIVNEVKYEGNASKDEFVELYNPTNNDVDLRCFALKRKSAQTGTGDPTAELLLVSKSSFVGTIKAHGFFLVAHPDGSYVGQADLKYSSDGYSIADNNVVLLYDPNGTVSDKVGYGSDAVKIKDSETTPFVFTNITTAQSIQRKNLSDSNNNSVDFWLRNESPKNSSGAPEYSSSSFFDFTATQVSGLSVSTGSLKFRWQEPDMSSVSPSAAAGLAYRITAATTTNPTVFPYSHGHFLADGESEPTFPTPEYRGAWREISFIPRCPESADFYVFRLSAINVSDPENSPRSATATFQFPPGTCGSAPVYKTLISEVQTESASSTLDEFIELYNPNNFDLDLRGWKLTKKTSGGTETTLVSNRTTNKFTGSIKAKGYLLIAHPSSTLAAVPDITYANGNSIAADNTVLIYDAQGRVVDKLGYGAATDFEASVFGQNPANSQSIERKAYASSTALMLRSEEQLWGNGHDADNNASDFVLEPAGQPQNSASATEALPTAPNNFLVTVSTSTRRVTFSWREPVGAASSSTFAYQIKYRAAGAGDINKADMDANYAFLTPLEDRDRDLAYPTPARDGSSRSVSVGLCSFGNGALDFLAALKKDGALDASSAARASIGSMRYTYGSSGSCSPAKINDLTVAVTGNHATLGFTPSINVNDTGAPPDPAQKLRLTYVAKISDDRNRLANDFFNAANVSVSSEVVANDGKTVSRANSHTTPVTNYTNCGDGSRCTINFSANDLDPAKTYYVGVRSHYVFYRSAGNDPQTIAEVPSDEIAEISNIVSFQPASVSVIDANPYLEFSAAKNATSTLFRARVKQKIECPEKNEIPSNQNPKCDIGVAVFANTKEQYPSWVDWKAFFAKSTGDWYPYLTLRIPEVSFDPAVSPTTTESTMTGWNRINSFAPLSVPEPTLTPGTTYFSIAILKQWYWLDNGVPRAISTSLFYADPNQYVLQSE